MSLFGEVDSNLDLCALSKGKWLVQGLRRDPRPNKALEPTPYSLRSFLASAFGRGSPRALDLKTKMHHNSILQFYARLTFR